LASFMVGIADDDGGTETGMGVSPELT